MDKTIIRNDEEGFTLISLKLDMKDVFSQHFCDWMHELCIAHLANAFLKKIKPEEFEEILKNDICSAVTASAVAMMQRHMKELTNPDNQIKTFDEAKKMLLGGETDEM